MTPAISAGPPPLRPFFRTLKAGVPDTDGYKMQESEQGDEMASGIIDDPGVRRDAGRADPVHRPLIRGHLQRQSCDLHRGRGDAPPADVDDTAASCPACGRATLRRFRRLLRRGNLDGYL